MINIISTQANKSSIRGPYKVFKNLVKGLDLLGYPYVINRDLSSSKRLWIHDDIRALEFINSEKTNTIIGPNLVTVPNDLDKRLKIKNSLFIHPCIWTANWWHEIGFNICPIVVWPVGIDTDEFKPSNALRNIKKVLVYHKYRDPDELSQIVQLLSDCKISFRLLIYGQYEERYFKSILDDTSFIIWHGCHESQGIALQEALACDIPILVWDVKSLTDAKNINIFWEYSKTPCTTAPYFDERCGLKIFESSELGPALEQVNNNLSHYAPRSYILENLSLKKQAEEFCNLWEFFNMSTEDGYNELLKNSKSYKPNKYTKISELAFDSLLRKIKTRINSTLQKTFIGEIIYNNIKIKKIINWTEQDERLKEFYLKLIPINGLCFDIGANNGNRTKVFLRIGAKTIAVEPQRKLVKRLHQVFKEDGNFICLEKAVGSQEGEMDLYIGDEDTLSTLSTSWMNAVTLSGRFSQNIWQKKEKVIVTTLEKLIELYGVPDFIKIDVEGYELEVLKGLKQSVKTISFEFAPEFIENVGNSLHYLQSLGDIEVNYSLGENLVLLMDKWIQPSELIQKLSSYKGSSIVFGDIYVKFC